MRTDDAKLVRIARKLSRQARSAESEIFRAWSKSKTSPAYDTIKRVITFVIALFILTKGTQNPNAKHLSGSADLRTDDTKLVRIARKLSRQARSAESETFRAWSKSKTSPAYDTIKGTMTFVIVPFILTKGTQNPNKTKFCLKLLQNGKGLIGPFHS